MNLLDFFLKPDIQGDPASEAITFLLIPEQEKESLHQQLLRLESVCKFLNISGLHLGNLIFTCLGQGNPQVVLNYGVPNEERHIARRL